MQRDWLLLYGTYYTVTVKYIMFCLKGYDTNEYTKGDIMDLLLYSQADNNISYDYIKNRWTFNCQDFIYQSFTIS